ncbi:MAG: Spy/CpxP family protein refolding chaperone [Bacteroidota bacterium]
MIKSLPLQQVEGYLAGRGLGYAKPAELNGYPGPKHVLELADSLALTPAQREATQARFDAMQVEAQRQGRAFLAAEAALDSLFAYSAATAESVRRLTEEAAAIEAQLRLSHLDAHMAMMDVLTPEQIADYSRLRGYTRGDMAGHHGGGGHHGHP